MSEKELWRSRIPTRQPSPTYADRQASWLTWLLPPTKLRDIPLWAIPRLTLPGLAFSIGNLIAHYAPVTIGGWVMVALAIPGVLFIATTQSLAKGNQALGFINFGLLGFGVFIVLGYLL
jgi:hypothetical protein